MMDVRQQTPGAGRTVILGGGPAGLTAAHTLCRAGAPVEVFERDSEVGGLAKTISYKDYRFDLGGHRFHTRIESVQAMWEDLLGDDLLLRSRLSRILYRRRMFHYPLRPLDALFGLGPVASLGVLASYLKARLRPTEPEATFEDWVSNRFGRRLYEAFFKSYTEKVLGVPCTEVSADWATQRITGLSLSLAIREAVFNTRPDEAETLIHQFHYPRLGPGMLWQRVAERITAQGGAVHCGQSVISLRRSDRRIESIQVRRAGGTEAIVPGDHFVSSMALRDLVLALDPPAPPPVVQAAAHLGHRDFIVVALIVARSEMFPDTWIYVHDPGVRVGRVQNNNNWSPDMVPDAKTTCLGMEYFCTRGDDLWRAPDRHLVDLAAGELERLGLGRRAEVIDGTVVRVPQAYPVYGLAYRANLKTVLDFLSGFGNLWPIGRNGRHCYVNQDLAMASAMKAATAILGAPAVMGAD